MQGASWCLAGLVVVMLTAPRFPSATGQYAVPVTHLQRWQLRSQAHLDLWYHGLAVIGYEGFGLLPLYDRDYASEIREIKQARGIGPTPLDTLARRLLREFDRDSVFELFHFVPLYFDHSSPESMLEALAAVARGREPVDVGAKMVAAVITRSSSRKLLGEYVDALQTEWDVFFEAYWKDGAAERTRRLGAVQAIWDERLGPALHPFLARQNLTGGLAFPSPAVGAEGRIFVGVPRDQRDNRVAMWLPRSPAEPEVVAFALVRELCYPLVSQVVAESGAGRGNRVVAERLSSYGAVRCGSVLLERYIPDLVPAYQRTFMGAADEPEDSSADFTMVFPVDPELYQRILAAVDS